MTVKTIYPAARGYFNVNSQRIRVSLSSLLDSSLNRNWEVRLVKLFKTPFRSSRSWAMSSSCKFTNSVQPQQHETELNDIILNYKNLTADLLRLSLPFYYWQSHLPYGSADGLLCIQFAVSGIPTMQAWNSSRLISGSGSSKANDKNFCNENNLHPQRNKPIKSHWIST